MDRLRKMQCCKSWLVPLDLCLRKQRGCFLPDPQDSETEDDLFSLGWVSKRNRTQNPCGMEPNFCSHCLQKCKAQGFFFSWLWFNMLRLMLRRSLAANSIHAFSQIAWKAARLTHLCNLGTFGLRTSHFVWHCCSTCKSRFFQFCLLNLLLPRLKEVPMLKISKNTGRYLFVLQFSYVL